MLRCTQRLYNKSGYVVEYVILDDENGESKKLNPQTVKFLLGQGLPIENIKLSADGRIVSTKRNGGIASNLYVDDTRKVKTLRSKLADPLWVELDIKDVPRDKQFAVALSNVMFATTPMDEWPDMVYWTIYQADKDLLVSAGITNSDWFKFNEALATAGRNLFVEALLKTGGHSQLDWLAKGVLENDRMIHSKLKRMIELGRENIRLSLVVIIHTLSYSKEHNRFCKALQKLTY